MVAMEVLGVSGGLRRRRITVEHVAEVHGLLMGGVRVYDLLKGRMLICGNYVLGVCVYMPGPDAVPWGGKFQRAEGLSVCGR